MTSFSHSDQFDWYSIVGLHVIGTYIIEFHGILVQTNEYIYRPVLLVVKWFCLWCLLQLIITRESLVSLNIIDPFVTFWPSYAFWLSLKAYHACSTEIYPFPISH